MDQYYYEEGYIDSGYHVYIGNAVIDLRPYIDEGYIDPSYYEYYGITTTLTGELSLVEGELEEASASLTTAFTQSSIVVKTVDAVSTQTSQFTQTVTASRIIQIAAEFTSAFAPVMTVSAIRNSFAVLDNTTTLSVDAVANRSVDIALSSIVNQSLSGIRFAGLTATLSSQFTQTSNINATASASSAQSSAFTLTSNIGKLKEANAQFVSRTELRTAKYINGARPLDLSGTNYQFVTTPKQYGTHALNVFSNGVVSTAVDETLIPLANQQFVVEFWWNNIDDKGGFADPVIMYLGSGTNDITSVPTTTAWAIGIETNNSTGQNQLQFRYRTSSSNVVNVAGNISDYATKMHIAVRRGSDGVIRLYKDNIEIANSSYTGTFFIATPASNSKLTFTGDEFSIGPANGVMFDEFSYRVGSSDISGYTGVIDNDPDSQKALYHFDNNLNDDISVIIRTTANLSSQSQLTVTSRVNYTAISQINSQVQQTTQAAKTAVNIASLSAQFNQSISAEDLDLAEIALSATFTLQAQVNDLDIASASLSSEFTLAVSTDKLKGAVINAGAMFTPTIDVVATRVGEIVLTSTFTTSASANYTVTFASTINSTSQIYSNSGLLIKNKSQLFKVKSRVRMEGFTWYNQPVTPPNLTPRPRNLSGTATFTTGKYSQSLLLDNSPQVTRTDSEFNYSQWGRLDLWFSPGDGAGATSFGNTIIEYSNDTQVSWRLRTLIQGTNDYRFRFEWFQSDGTARSLTSSQAIWTNSSDSTFKRFVFQKLDQTATITNNVSISDITGDIFISTDAPRTLSNATLKFGSNDRLNRIDELVFFKDSVKDQLPNTVLSDAPFVVSDQTNIIALYHFDGNLTDDIGVRNVGVAEIDSGSLLEIAEIQYLYTGSSSLNTNSQITASAIKTIGGISNVSVQSTFNCAATLVKNVQSTVSTQSNLSCAVKITRTAQSSLQNSVILTAEPYDFTKAESNLTSTISLTAQPYDFTKTGAELFVDALTDVTGLRIFQLDSNFSSIATQLTVAFRNATGTVLLESEFAQSTTAIKTANITTSFNISEFTQTTQAQNILFAQSNISAESTQTVDATKFRPAQANLSSNFTINIDVVKITGVTSNNTSEFTQTTVNDRLRDNTIALTSAFTQNTVGLRVKLFTVSVNSNSEILATAFSLVQYQANLISNGFVLSDATIIHIDPFTTYMIPQETRNTRISEESRLYVIKQETRVNTIIGSAL